MYFVDVRQEGSHRAVPGMSANLNAGDPTRWTYVPDLTRQSRSAGSWQIQKLRLTLQATARNKISLFWDEQLPCSGATWSANDDGCRRQPTSGFIYGGSATSAPETSSYTGSGRFQRVQQASWSSPATNRLLLEAGFGTYLSRYGGSLLPGSPAKSLIQVSEQCTAGCAANGNIPGLTYRSQNPVESWIGAHTWRAAASYVTGAHSMKFGYQGAFHVWDTTTVSNDSFLSYRVNNGIPPAHRNGAHDGSGAAGCTTRCDRDSSRQKLEPTSNIRVLAYRLREHPGTEAEPPLVLVSPWVSVARGVAASSLVIRPAGV